jgi:hypothetical protein
LPLVVLPTGDEVPVFALRLGEMLEQLDLAEQALQAARAAVVEECEVQHGN